MRLEYRVTAADHGQRAVDVLAARTGMSRLLSKKIRLYGLLTRNGLPHRMIDPVCAGDVLVATDQLDSVAGADLRPVAGIRVCFQDSWLVVVNKPSGLVTHPSYLHESRSLTSLLADQPLHPVTRLDRDTTGVVLIALNGHAHHVLTSHKMQKTYLAAIHGRLPGRSGLIQAPIRRSQNSIMLRETHVDGLPARTLWRELYFYAASDISLVRFELLTGRTHQIRVHSRSAGCPLVGDSLYGPLDQPGVSGSAQGDAQGSAQDNGQDSLDRLIGHQALHAAAICLRHPISGQIMKITARLPEDFRLLLQELRRREHAIV